MKSLKTERRKRNRSRLIDAGHDVVNHHLSTYDMDLLLQLALNELAKDSGSIRTSYSRLYAKMNHLKQLTRVVSDEIRGKIVSGERADRGEE